MLLSQDEARELKIPFVTCPADAMIREGQFEGEVTITKIPSAYRTELLNLIENFGERAMERDNQHRVSNVQDDDDTIVVTTTENQLAVKLGKKIKHVFNKVDVDISYSEEPYQVARVSVQFKNN